MSVTIRHGDCREVIRTLTMVMFALVAVILAYAPAVADEGHPAIAPGTILLLAAPAPYTGGYYEAHPGVILKDGSTCDMLSLLCIRRMEIDFGYAGAHEIFDRGFDAVLHIGR